MRSVFNQVFESQRDYAQSFNLTLECVSNNLTLKGDVFLIEQAVTNLVKNAIEHADKESSIAMIAEKNSSGSVTISVTNQGEPIPDYAIDKLFDRFYSLPKANGSKGTGIGLSFVKEIAILHGGEAKIESTDSGVIARILI